MDGILGKFTNSNMGDTPSIVGENVFTEANNGMLAEIAVADKPATGSTEYRKENPALEKDNTNYSGGSLERPGFVKGVIVKDVKGDYSYYTFQFNPAEMGGQNHANWNVYSPPGTVLPIASFMHMNAPTLELELFVDCTDISQRRKAGNAGPLTVNDKFIGVWADILAAITFVNPDVKKKEFNIAGCFSSPAPVILSMGPVITRTVLTAVDWKITQWFQDLVPSRATIKLSFTGIVSTFANDFADLKKNQIGLATSGLVPTANSPTGATSIQKIIDYYGSDKIFVAQ